MLYINSNSIEDNLYNVSTGQTNSFQIGGLQNTYINTSGLTVNNTITCNSLNTGTATIHSFYS